jgi:predicted HAD superfamily Cof-like phosphohydrolase
MPIDFESDEPQSADDEPWSVEKYADSIVSIDGTITLYLEDLREQGLTRLQDTDFERVCAFHQKFGSLTHYHPRLPQTREEYLNIETNVNHLSEELDEIDKAWEEGNIVELADGLVDLVYVALGVAHKLGLPWDALFAEVHRANMTKRRATSAAESTRGSIYDIVKPENFIPPQIEEVLRRKAWDEQNGWPEGPLE